MNRYSVINLLCVHYLYSSIPRIILTIKGQIAKKALETTGNKA